MRAGILAVGTELTDGQIVNKNAAWLSAELKRRGVRAWVHLTVPDDRTAILKGLASIAADCDVLFVTGGLGPTSDDFTRELVAEWAETPLEFHEPSWKMIEERLSARGYPVQDMQRQQCLFPKGAIVLTNSQGTANGFRLRARDRDVVVLPGPPREIAAIWNEPLAPWLNELTKNLDRTITKSWDCLGLGESQVAALVEPLVQNAGLEIGYRVHLPYVEVKASYPASRAASVKKPVEAIENALSPVAALRDGQDAAELFAKKISSLKAVSVHDQATGLVLFQRLAPALRAWPPQGRWCFCDSPAGDGDGVFWLTTVDEHEVKVGLRFERQTRETRIVAPMKSPAMAERRKQYFAERALLFWCAELPT